MIQDPDYHIGATRELGSYLFTPEAIVEFAKKFDPQPFHVDPEAARDSIFGGLCASGWHTASIWMKLNLEQKIRRDAEREVAGLPNPEYGPSPGFRNLRWLRPVFAGETISYRLTTTGLKPMRGRPGWSILSALAEAHNENGDPVMSFDSAVLVCMPPELAENFS